jgi:hypothetical protein
MDTLPHEHNGVKRVSEITIQDSGSAQLSALERFGAERYCERV